MDTSPPTESDSIHASEQCFAAGCRNESGWMGGVLCKMHYDLLPPVMTGDTVSALPCPFCNWPASHETSNGVGAVCIECSDCGCSGPVEETYAEAVSAWNARSAPEPVEDETIRTLCDRIERIHVAARAGNFQTVIEESGGFARPPGEDNKDGPGEEDGPWAKGWDERRSASPHEPAADAERYRFLRQPGNAIVYAVNRNAWGKGASGHVRYETPEQLDAAVDAARLSTTKSGDV